jgi:hypothetical protein
VERDFGNSDPAQGKKSSRFDQEVGKSLHDFPELLRVDSNTECRWTRSIRISELKVLNRLPHDFKNHVKHGVLESREHRVRRMIFFIRY